MSLWLFVDGTPFAVSTKIEESRRVEEKYLELVQFYKKYGHCLLAFGKEDHGWVAVCKNKKELDFKLPAPGAMFGVSVYLATAKDDESLDSYLCENPELKSPLEIKITLYKRYDKIHYTESVTALVSLKSKIYLKIDDLEEGEITLVTFTPKRKHTRL